MQEYKCPCIMCKKFPGDCEDTKNGMHVVYCEDNVIRYVSIDDGCAWFQGLNEDDI